MTSIHGTMVLKFHLDENIPLSIAKGLRRRNIDVTTTQDQQLLGASDETQLQHAHLASRVLVTYDADFLKLSHSGRPHSGIVFWTDHNKPLGPFLERISALWRTTTGEEMSGRVQYF